MTPCHAYTGVRAAVFGASGFIGRHVARALSTCGAELHIVARDVAGVAEARKGFGVSTRVWVADLARPGSAQSVLREIRPSIVFNLAGYGVDRLERDKNMAYAINQHLVDEVCKTMAVLRDDHWLGQDVVHAGSAAEYGLIGGNLAEDSKPEPVTLYGESKLAGTRALEAVCAASPCRGVVARAFTVYGPGERPGRLLPALISAARNQTIVELSHGAQQRDFVYVDDVAQGLLRLGLIHTNGAMIVNVATGRLVRVREFVETAAAILGIPQQHLLFGALPVRTEEEANQEPVAVELLRQLTSWVPPTPFAEGIRLAWTAALLERGVTSA